MNSRDVDNVWLEFGDTGDILTLRNGIVERLAELNVLTAETLHSEPPERGLWKAAFAQIVDPSSVDNLLEWLSAVELELAARGALPNASRRRGRPRDGHEKVWPEIIELEIRFRAQKNLGLAQIALEVARELGPPNTVAQNRAKYLLTLHRRYYGESK
jgi:hypothetical protein